MPADDDCDDDDDDYDDEDVHGGNQHEHTNMPDAVTAECEQHGKFE